MVGKKLFATNRWEITHLENTVQINMDRSRSYGSLYSQQTNAAQNKSDRKT